MKVLKYAVAAVLFASCLIARAESPLSTGIASENLEMVRSALDAGASPNQPDPESQRLPLHLAVTPSVPGVAAIVELLV